MKTLIKTMISAVLWLTSLSIIAQSSFELIINGEDTEVATGTIELPNEVFLTYGILHEKTTSLSYPILLRYSDSLNFEFDIFPKQDTAYGFSHGILKENGNFLFIGGLWNYTVVNKPNTIYLCEMTPNFELVWESYYPIPDEDYYLISGDFMVDDDNNIVLSAGMGIVPYSTIYLYLAKFNMEGELLAENFLPNYQVSMYNDIIHTSDNEGYAVIGQVNKNNILGNLLEFDQNLNISTPWETDPFGGEDYVEPPITAKWLSNGTLFLANRGMGDQDVEFRLCNSDYTTIKDTLIFDSEIDYIPVRQGMDFVDEDMIWICTYNFNPPFINGTEIFRVYIYDSEMNIKGMKTFGGDNRWWFEHLMATSDGGCIVTGFTREEEGGTQSGDYDLYIKKLAPDDIISNAEDTPIENDRDVALYPNPVKDYLYIETVRKNLSIQILDNIGRIAHQQKIASLPYDKLNLSTLTKGIYFYHILDGNRIIQKGKFMKQ